MDLVVTTPCGQVAGCMTRVPGIVAFKGIRYATAGRWEYPRQVTSWDGVYDATQYGSCCYQPRAFYNEEENTKKYFYYNEFRKGETYRYSEDCLFLNIFVPDTAKEGDALPVLVSIHGGSFTGDRLLIPMACSLLGVSQDVAMQMVGVGFIIGVVQDSLETAINSSGDVIFCATAEFREKMKKGEKIDALVNSFGFSKL